MSTQTTSNHALNWIQEKSWNSGTQLQVAKLLTNWYWSLQRSSNECSKEGRQAHKILQRKPGIWIWDLVPKIKQKKKWRKRDAASMNRTCSEPHRFVSPIEVEEDDVGTCVHQFLYLTRYTHVSSSLGGVDIFIFVKMTRQSSTSNSWWPNRTEPGRALCCSIVGLSIYFCLRLWAFRLNHCWP